MSGDRVVAADSRSVPGFGSAFVGRDRELALVLAALANPPAVVVIDGEAGIGKSRLVREARSSEDGTRFRWLTVTCPPFRDPFTLGPLVDAVRRAVDDVRTLRLSALGGALRPLFPEWADQLPPPLEPLDDARGSRHRQFRAFTELLTRLGVDVLVLEDAHWADEATLEFVVLLASGTDRPASVVVTFRPEDLPTGSLLSRLTARVPANTAWARVSLRGLDEATCGELVSSMLGEGPVSEEFTRVAHRGSGGIPFVLEELIRLLGDRADLIHRHGHWMRRNLAVIDVPPTIRYAVAERVARLPPDAVSVLRAAAVLAEPTTEAILMAVAGPDTDERGLTDAIRSGLLIDDDGSLNIRHVLATAAIYETIPMGQRRQTHARAARALAASPGQPVARLAHHFRRAGHMAEWYQYAELAAAQALAAGDHTSAVSLLRDLLTHADRPDRSVLRLVNSIWVSNLRPPDRYTELTDALRSMLDRLDLPPDQRALVRFPLARLLLLADRDEEGRAEMLRVIPDLGDDPVTASRAMLSLAIPKDSRSSLAEHRRWLRHAAELPRPADPAGRLAYQANEVSALLAMGLDEGWVAAEELPDDAPSATERHALASVRVNMADAAMGWGWYDRAAGYLAGAGALDDRVQDPGIHDLIGSTGCHVDWFVGRWDGLAERARAIEADEDALRSSRLEARLVAALMILVADAEARAAEMFGSILADPHSELGLTIEAAAYLGRCWLRRGNADKALRVTEEPVAVLRRKRVWTMATELVPVRVAALLAADQKADGADVVDWFGRGLRGRDMPAPRAALAWCRALVAEHHGDHLGAARRYARAATAWRQMPRPYDALLAAERRAGCLLAANRKSDALAALIDVYEKFVELGARSDADRVARRLGEHGKRVRPSRRGRRGYGEEISPREMDVLRLLVTGMTNREIARALSRSPKTVAAQLNSAMRKLGVTSRTALAVTVLDTGLVPAEGSNRPSITSSAQLQGH